MVTIILNNIGVAHNLPYLSQYLLDVDLINKEKVQKPSFSDN